MNEQRRAEIKNIIEHFRGMQPFGATPTQEAIDKHCQAMRYERITEDNYKDFLAQVEHDEIMSRLLPAILTELQNLVYIHDFDKVEARKQGGEKNEEVRMAIAKLFEDHAVLYRDIETLGRKIGGVLGQVIDSAGISIYNKALQVLFHLARAHFGEELNMLHVRDYAEKVFKDAKK